jgi:hypothetical protein
MTTAIRTCITLGLNISSLFLGLVRGGTSRLAHDQSLQWHGTAGLHGRHDSILKTPEFERWQTTNDRLGRLGLLLVALGTAAAVVAQIIDRPAQGR